MIALLLDIYLLVVWLIFFKFKLLKFDLKAKISTGVIGFLFCFGILIAVNFLHPQSMDARVFEHVVPVATRLSESARVIEVPIKPNVPVHKGDVLFVVDAEPYQIEVARLEAALAEAEQNVPQLKAAFDAATASADQSRQQLEYAKQEYERIRKLFEKEAATAENFDQVTRNQKIAEASLAASTAQAEKARLAMDAKMPNGENVEVAQIRQQLAKAKYDLAQTTVRAPADGFVVNLQLQPGFIVPPGQPVLAFVQNPEGVLAVTFPQEYLGTIEPENEVEVCLDMYPGKTLKGKVDSVIWATGQGQLAASGTLPSETQAQAAGRFGVRVQISPDDMKAYRLPAGASGAAAVYTNHGTAFKVVRRVVLRWYTWLNYLKITM